MDGVAVRFGRKEDYITVAEIAGEVQAVHVDLRPDIYRKPDSTLDEERFGKLIEGGCLIVAEAAGRICGYTVFITRIADNPLMHKRRVLYIDAMAVKEEYKHNGAGNAMFLFIKEYAESNSFDAIELTVLSQNRAAVGAYEKWGFGFKSFNMDMRLKRAE